MLWTLLTEIERIDITLQLNSYTFYGVGYVQLPKHPWMATGILQSLYTVTLTLKRLKTIRQFI